jgi:hypothetical protein
MIIVKISCACCGDTKVEVSPISGECQECRIDNDLLDIAAWEMREVEVESEFRYLERAF